MSEEIALDKVALVLGGGSGRAAFQFGAIKYIEEEIKKKRPDFDYCIIAGVSGGALNAVMLAMKKFKQLEEIWNGISNEQVYKGSTGINLIVALRILCGRKYLLSNRPLRDKLKEYVTLKEVSPKYDLRIGVVSLVSGEYRALGASDFDKDREFRRAVLASTSIPMVFKPVRKISLKNKLSMVSVVDGGIRNVTPLGDVVDHDPSLIIIINCYPLKRSLEPDSSASKNMFRIAKRSLAEIAINEIFNSDVREFLRINSFVQQAKDENLKLKKGNKDYKDFNYILIEPEGDLGDGLDFSQEIIQVRIAKGYEAAQKAFSGW